MFAFYIEHDVKYITDYQYNPDSVSTRDIDRIVINHGSGTWYFKIKDIFDYRYEKVVMYSIWLPITHNIDAAEYELASNTPIPLGQGLIKANKTTLPGYNQHPEFRDVDLYPGLIK